jgi:hypothetical protein
MKILQAITYHLKVCEKKSNFVNFCLLLFFPILIASNQVPSNNDVNIEMQIPDSLKVKFENELLFTKIISFQFDDGLNLNLITNNRSNENRTLTMALTLVRINPIQQSESMLGDPGHISLSDQYVPQNTDQNINNTNSSIPIQSLVQNFTLAPNNGE